MAIGKHTIGLGNFDAEAFAALALGSPSCDSFILVRGLPKVFHGMSPVNAGIEFGPHGPGLDVATPLDTPPVRYGTVARPGLPVAHPFLILFSSTVLTLPCVDQRTHISTHPSLRRRPHPHTNMRLIHPHPSLSRYRSPIIRFRKYMSILVHPDTTLSLP